MAGGSRIRVRSWLSMRGQEDDESPRKTHFDSVQSPPKVASKSTLLDTRTPGGQAMVKRNRRSFSFSIDDSENPKDSTVNVYNAFEEAARLTTPYRREQAFSNTAASRLYKRDQAVSDSALYRRLQSTRISDIAFDLADIDGDDEEPTPAHGIAAEDVLPELKPVEPARSESVHDVVANDNGELELLPLGDQPQATRRKVSDLHQDEVVTIRVFRFLEDKDQESHPWEQALHNVNSGSLLWLIVHMLPKMHSVSGAKYGKWFTVHTVNVMAKHFGSSYHMFNEGNAGQAKTFGASSATTGLVTGKKLAKGYFWFASPVDGCPKAPGLEVSSQEHLEAKGWQHLRREGPFDGEHLLEEWCKQGEAMDEDSLQRTLEEWML